MFSHRLMILLPPQSNKVKLVLLLVIVAIFRLISDKVDKEW